MLGSSLATRISLLLLAGFALVQLIVITALALPAGDGNGRSYPLPAPEQLAAIVDAIEAVPAAERLRLLPALNRSLYTVQLVMRPVAPRGTDKAGDLRQLRSAYAAALPHRSVEVRGLHGPLGQLVRRRPGPLHFFSPVRISVSPVAGGTLVLDSRPSDAARADMRRRAWRGAVAVLLVLGALLFAIRQTTRPIARLNEGVRRFGSALSAPDVVPAGSAELRELAVAFNDMKARIAGLVEERTRILAAVAHDLRTYLTRLRLRADYIVDDEQRSRAENDLSEMAALLDDTLLFAKPRQRPSFGQSINVADELVAVASIRRDAGQEVSVDLEGIGRATTIMVDPLSLRRMLANLLDNGLRYGSHVMLAASQSGSAVAISVCDDGPGVPDELLRRLGEPYLRVESSRDRSTGGAGLGLAIVRALAAENGAELQLANLAPGFRASILFPATAASPTVAQPSRWLSGE